MSRPSGGNSQEDLGQLYDRVAPSLFRYALMLLAHYHEAEDVIQHVFATLAKRGVSGLDSPDHYLRASVRNECFTRLGRSGPSLVSQTDGQLLESIAAADDRPEIRLSIEKGLRNLPPDQREVVHLKVFEGRSFQEIADLSGESVNTVASRYRYAMEKLKTTFGVRRTDG
jgi:RNA polymerase sigma-70 factor (ECF subfamily)